MKLNNKRIEVNQPNIGNKEVRAVKRILKSGNLTSGNEVSLFEREFSEFVLGSSCIAVNSGTSALHLGLLSLGIGEGDEVIVPSFTFAATANAVKLTGATPVFADIESNFFCLDELGVSRLVTNKTKAIIAVHLYGHPAPMRELRKICDGKGIFLIEDAAQAHLASIDSKPVGTFGDFAIFSFYSTKNITTAEGGILTTNNSDIVEKVKLLRNQGMLEKYKNQIAGYNNRMSDIHAALGRVQLRRIEEFTIKRNEIAQTYINSLSGVEVPKTKYGYTHVYHQFTVKVKNGYRDTYIKLLDKNNISSGVFYPVPVHVLPAYNSSEVLPTTEEISKVCLSIPIHPGLTKKQINKVIKCINNISKQIND